MEDIKIDELTKIYIKMRDTKDKLKKHFEEEEKKIDDQMDAIKEHFLTACKEQGVDSLKTQYGTVTRKIHERYWTSDWTSMYDVIRQFDVPELLEKRIQQTNIKQFLTEHPDAHPAGLNVDREYIISVRRKT